MAGLLNKTERERNAYYLKHDMRGLFNFPLYIPEKRCPEALRFDRYPSDYYSLVEKYFSTANKDANGNRKMLNEKVYLAGDAGISYRTMFHWAENDILPDGIKLNGWKRFSLVELTWIRAVEIMRQFGLSLEEICEVKHWVLQYDEEKQIYPWFEFYIALAASSRFDPYIIILPILGFAEVGTSRDIENLKFNCVKPEFGKSRSKLLISLKEILDGLVEVTPARILMDITGIDRELYLITHVNHKRYKEITLRLNVGGGFKEIIKSKTYSDKDISSLDKKELEDEDFFGDVIHRYSNGKMQSVEIKEKRKIK